MRRLLIFSILLPAAGACVDAREPPPIPVQAEIAYGPKVYLVDATLGAPPAGDKCTRLGAVLPTGTSSTATVAVPAADGVVDDLGNSKPINSAVPHNCYVEVKPRNLRVDAVEVTNELFQLCVDSGACTKPDPSKASKSQVCSDESKFDQCPVVEISHTEATTFCKWIGRRLPSGIEHLIMRQGPNASVQSGIGVYPVGGEDKKPATCNEAVLGGLGCKRPSPSSGGKGGAPLDVVNGTSGQVYDLMGNQSEWSSDLLPVIRGNAEGLPWFCQGALPPRETPQSPVVCPQGAICVRGQYQPEGLPIGDYPVCVAFGKTLRAISGGHGSLFGGNFADTAVDRGHAGTFARRQEKEPDGTAATEYGFRCAGDVAAEADEVESSVE